MISSETRAQIRRYFYAEHWKIGTIARELGVHPDAVRKRHRGGALPEHAATASFGRRSLHRGKPGVWFFSLDAGQKLAVRVARRFFHLPYLMRGSTSESPTET
jgi:Uncharacterized conserved protein (COG2071)